jgi:hypothetical protein
MSEVELIYLLDGISIGLIFSLVIQYLGRKLYVER